MLDDARRGPQDEPQRRGRAGGGHRCEQRLDALGVLLQLVVGPRRQPAVQPQRDRRQARRGAQRA